MKNIKIGKNNINSNHFFYKTNEISIDIYIDKILDFEENFKEKRDLIMKDLYENDLKKGVSSGVAYASAVDVVEKIFSFSTIEFIKIQDEKINKQKLEIDEIKNKMNLLEKSILELSNVEKIEKRKNKII